MTKSEETETWWTVEELRQDLCRFDGKYEPTGPDA